jgi:hypothetical protein
VLTHDGGALSRAAGRGMIAIEQEDLGQAALLEEVGRRRARDARTDDDGVVFHLHVPEKSMAC